MNSQRHDAMNEWMNPPALLLNRQICHLCLTLRDHLIPRHEHGGSSSSMFTFDTTRKQKEGRLFFVFFWLTKITKQCSESVEMCLSEPAGGQILAADVQVNSLWVNQLLMHADNSQTGAAHTASLPSISTRTPHNKRWPFIWNWMWQPCVISL